MVKRIISLLILVPIAIVLIVLSVANRQSVTLALNPFDRSDQVMSVTLPFFVYLFGAIIIRHDHRIGRDLVEPGQASRARALFEERGGEVAQGSRPAEGRHRAQKRRAPGLPGAQRFRALILLHNDGFAQTCRSPRSGDDRGCDAAGGR